MRAHQREALRQHSWRGIEVAEPFDALGGEAGFLLELLDRGRFRRGVRIVVADQPRWEFDAAAVEWHACLLDQDHLPVMFGEDDDSTDLVRPAGILPLAAAKRANEFSLPHHFDGRQVFKVHSSMSLSGISFVSPAVRGKCSVSTTPTRSTAATIPSATRPSLTSTSNAVIASPQVSGVVTLVIASSPMISARRSAIDR